MRFLVVAMAVLIGFLSVATSAGSATKEKKQTPAVKLVYFHATMRCEGCIKVEAAINRAMNKVFAKEIKSGKVVFESIDFQDDKNAALAKQFNVEEQTLIAMKMKNGKVAKSTNMKDFWNKCDKDEDIEKYVRTEVGKLLKK